MSERGVRSWISGEARGPVAAVGRSLLGVLEPGYRMAVAVRNTAFDRGWRGSVRLGRPTISIGNLTAGGTGKTPMVIALAHRLHERGECPAVLTRGYHGGDEVEELRAALAGVAEVEPDPTRARGALRVLERSPDTTVFLLDDGFQHRQAHRDLDLVLIDATAPFGHDHLLPRGLLREPASGLRRADAVVVTRADQAGEDRRAAVDEKVRRITGKLPIAHAAHQWAGLREDGGMVLPVSELAGRRVIGVCGLGNPRAFEASLREVAGQLAAFQTMPDHHRYTHIELADLFDRALRERAGAIVTSEKDYVKWAPLIEHHHLTPPVPIYRPCLAVRFLDGEDALGTLLGSVPER